MIKLEKYPAVPYIAPFAAFVILLAMRNSLPLDPKPEYVVRVLAVSLILVLISRQAVSGPPVQPVASTGVGIAVFAVWIAPDLIWPSYRDHWIFQNSLTGTVSSSLPSSLRSDPAFLFFRLYGTAAVVPIIEELFWRGWLMRYIIDKEFKRVALGTYTAFSFWFTALLFASEHGAFWDVGLIAGVVYNGWMLRTRNLADCMIAHAVTNACLAIYVLVYGKWQYWL